MANSGKAAGKKLALQACKLIEKAGRTVLADEETASFAGLKGKSFSSVAALARSVDLILVFGGDGTMLRVSRELTGDRTPVLGINAGRLGFLTAIPAQELPQALKMIWDGQFSVEQRALLEARGTAEGMPLKLSALNDIVISRGSASRMIELDVMVNGAPLTCYRCDGLIVSTPTGSTAYSLSAGGAIISPDARVIALTPICPHTLSNRSIIISMDSVVEVRVASERVETNVAADGQVQVNLATGDRIRICRSSKCLSLLQIHNTHFFETVRKKLHWSGSNV